MNSRDGDDLVAHAVEIIAIDTTNCSFAQQKKEEERKKERERKKKVFVLPFALRGRTSRL